ncbi:MAG: hypothetical protein ABI831_02565 [Betaproteobacteria bacterium]
MRIEAFSEGKYLDDPDANEDAFLILPGRGFAVIDGVTDISGRIVDGMRTGRLASRIVQRAAAEYLCSTPATEGRPEALIEHVSSALRDAYVAHGVLDEVRAHPALRFGATMTLAVDMGAMFRFILVGDSGLRLNGSEVIVVDDGLDMVTATLRREAYRLIAERGGDLDAQRRVSRLCSFHGAAELHPDMPPWLDADGLAEIRRRSVVSCTKRFPEAPLEDIEGLLERGISGQARFQNNTLSPFSYSVFDGFDIPMAVVRVLDRQRDSLQSIELYTDGYFKAGATVDLAAWEAAFEEVERVDPEKIEKYASVKGSSERMRTDDRTVVIVRL